MTDHDDAPSEPASIRLARTRAELAALFEPEEPVPREASAGEAPRGGFPRSKTMRMLSKGAGSAGFAMMALALFATSPAKARLLLRYLPMSAITKIVVAHFINSRGERR